MLLLTTDNVFPNDLTLVIEVGKIVAYFSIAAGLIKVAEVGRRYYDAWQIHIFEHRLVVADLFERRPEQKELFQRLVEAKAPAVFRPRSKSRGNGL